MFSGLVLLAASALAVDLEQIAAVTKAKLPKVDVSKRAEVDGVANVLVYLGGGCKGKALGAAFMTIDSAECEAAREELGDCEDVDDGDLGASSLGLECEKKEGFKPLPGKYFETIVYEEDEMCAGDHLFSGTAISLNNCVTIEELSVQSDCNDTHLITEAYTEANCKGDSIELGIPFNETCIELPANYSTKSECSGVSAVAPVFAMVAAAFFLLA